MELRYLLVQVALVWFVSAVYASNICRKSDITVTDIKVTIKSFTASLALTTEDIITSKMLVGCPQGYQMRMDYAWTFLTYPQPKGNTLIEVNCSQLYALSDHQICFKGCPLPAKVGNAVITPLPAISKKGAPYSDGDIIQVKCGEDRILATCQESTWSNLSEYSCPYSNTSSRSFSVVLDTTTNMGEEISQIYDIAAGLVDTLSHSQHHPKLNYILVPFNDPDFYPMVMTTNGSIFLKHLETINNHGASGGKDCPELTLAAIQKAVRQSYEESEVFVFTDASSKEPERKELIIQEATEKGIRVNFILTGYCGDNQMADQAMYHEIADATNGFVVAVAKSQIREVASLIEGSLMDYEQVLHQVIPVGDEQNTVVVQIACDKQVRRMTVTAACSSVHVVSVSDDRGQDIRYQQISTLRDMITISLQPSIADEVYVNISCSERGSAVVTAYTASDISFTYTYFLKEVGETMVQTTTMDMGSRAVVYVVFGGAAVYDVEVTPVISNQPGTPISMKKYLESGYMMEFTVPNFTFHFLFRAKVSGQTIERLSAPIIPRIGCPALPRTSALPSTLLTKDTTAVSFHCKEQCDEMSHARDIVCNHGNWSESPPVCTDAGYACSELVGPGNGTLLFQNRVVYSVSMAKCGDRVEVHCNTYFDLEGVMEARCTPYGWTNKINRCIPVSEDSSEVTAVLGSWWMWVVISVTAVVTLSVLSTVICILVMRRGKRKRPLRATYERGADRPPGRDTALQVDEDLYEVVDSSGNYPPGCGGNYGNGSVCNESLQRNRPPMPPPLHTNSYGNLPSNVPSNMSTNPLYSSRVGNVGNDYMPMSGDVRSNSMIYEEMAQQQAGPPPPTEDYNPYDYITGHV